MSYAEMSETEQYWNFVLRMALEQSSRTGWRHQVYGVRKPWGWTYYMIRLDQLIRVCES